MPDPDPYRVHPGATVRLEDIDPDQDGGLGKADARAGLDRLHRRMRELQKRLRADRSRALLVIFQAMDTGGKDSTIRRVLGPLSPQGVHVWNFRRPSETQREHDFLWRIHRRVPGRGSIGVFNRSQYEDVIVARVRKLVDREVWRRRYGHINDFERLLTDEGVCIRKFYLHISRDEQKHRLQRRLARPDKHWKFDPADLDDRARWDEYRQAYEDALSRCSTEHAPWYIIPAQTRWYRDVLVAQVLVDALEGMDLRYPEPPFDPDAIEID